MIPPDRKTMMERPLLSQRERPFLWCFSTEGRKELRYVEGAGKRVAPEGGSIGLKRLKWSSAMPGSKEFGRYSPIMGKTLSEVLEFKRFCAILNHEAK